MAKSVVGLGVFLIPLSIGTWTPDYWEIHKAALLIGVVLVGWLCYSVAHFRQPGFAWHWHPLDWIVLVIGLSTGVSTLTSVNLWSSLTGLQGTYSETLPVTLAFIGLYGLSARLFRTSADRLVIWSSLISGVGFSLLLQLFQFSEVSLLPGSLSTNPLTSTLANSTIQIGILAAMVATTALFLWSKAEERWAKLAIAGVVTIGWLVMFILGQSIAWAVFALGMILVVIVQGNTKRGPSTRLVLVIVILAAAGMLSQFLKVTTYANIPSTRDVSLSQTSSMATAFASVAARPALGTGPNTWYDAFVQHRPLSYNQEATWSSRYIRSGSEWTQMLGTQGMVGLALWIGLLAIAGWEFWRSLRHGYSFTVMAALFAVATLALTAILTAWSFTLLTFAWVALGLGRAKVASREPQTLATRGYLPALSFAAAAILILLVGYPAFRLYRSEVLLASAQLRIDPAAPQAVIPTLQSALRLNERNGDAAVLLANAQAVMVAINVQKNNLTAAQQALTEATTTMRTAVERDKNNPAIYEAENNLLNSLGAYLPAPEQQANANVAFLRTLEPTNPIHDVIYGQTLMIMRARLNAQPASATPNDEQSARYLRLALAAYEEALRKKTDYLQARFARAEANIEGGQYQLALEDAERLTVTYPSAGAYWTLKGKALAKLERLDQAQTAFEQALDLEPRDVATYLEYATALKEAKKSDDAKTVIERGLEALPGNTQLQAELKSFDA